MSDTVGTSAKPIWVDLSTSDPEAARKFYSSLLGWTAEPNPDPAFGGYTVAQLGGRDVAGIGPVMGEGQPTAWAMYIGTPDASETAAAVEAAGGKVAVPPFDVMDQGRMGVFQDPSGAFFGVWQPGKMTGAQVMREPGSVGWTELNARGLPAARDFYHKVFGWEVKSLPMPEGMEYNELRSGGEPIGGAQEMPAMVPAEVPSHWLVYFLVDDIAATAARAQELGATAMMPVTDYPGGKFTILADAQGATFGLIAA
ncbi:MAG TPA: VOC family protein [Candidatus Dormibacteraeota bacterium]|jgi:hypothetical protein|nr:VOC family protein [Candidatus Dormibacteraeota bacterium]